MASKATTYRFDLPFPPSVNTYYRTSFRSRSVYLSEKGREFKNHVANAIGLKLEVKAEFPLNSPLFPTERLSLRIELTAGNRRSYDIDGRLKGLLDAMEGCVYANDEQIDELHVIRNPREKGAGRCLVIVAIREPQPS